MRAAAVRLLTYSMHVLYMYGMCCSCSRVRVFRDLSLVALLHCIPQTAIFHVPCMQQLAATCALQTVASAS